MSDLTDAIDAASRALIKVTEDEDSPCLADEEDCYRIRPVHFAWYQNGETGIVGETVAVARAVLAAAAPLIEAQVRAAVAEEIATDIAGTLAYFGLKPTPWADGYTNGNRDAAAIARRHAVKAPESHAAGREAMGETSGKDPA